MSSKAYRRGTHRSIEPAETLRRYRELAPHMGITRLANVTGLDYLGIPVVMATRPNGRSLSVSQGKGLDLDAAMTSAFMEAAETFHAEQIEPTIRRARVADIETEGGAIDLSRLPRVRGRELASNSEIAWTAGRYLDGGTPVWAPYEMVHTDYRLPLADTGGFFPLGSNGLASGNTIAEATCAALSELIERDAMTLWSHRSSVEKASRRIDPDSIDHDICAGLIGRLTQRGMRVTVWDITTDVGVPAFLCRMEDASDNSHALGTAFYGSGCHVARDVAFSRAVTEAAQSRLTYIAGSRDDLTRRHYSHGAAESLLSFAFAAWERGFPPRNFGDVPDVQTDSFDGDLAVLLDSLRNAGITHVALVDLSRPDLQLPVVRVIAPGLEFIDDNPAYVPGERARRVMAERE